MVGKKAFLIKLKHQYHLSHEENKFYYAQSWKERRLLCESVVPTNKQTLTLKNEGKKSFSYKTKASMSFILISRMSLLCPFKKRKEIIMWICVCPKWQMDFNSKKLWEEKVFF